MKAVTAFFFCTMGVVKDIKANESFPIKIEYGSNIAFEPTAGYGYYQFIVAANGFVIASFVDEGSMLWYLDYLKQYGFSKFPKKIMDILRAQHEQACVNEMRKHGKLGDT
ncbi:MAG TPA: hypothetical protein VEB40_00875 [Flavipsychrobacter sp.]|nr:hypothetical protein [Flavipsychrobacter sp.]